MNLYQLLCFFLASALTRCSSDCPKIYQRFSQSHTFCKNSTCAIIKQGVTEADKEKILKVHNDLRNRLASGNETDFEALPSSANMVQMEWDEELARIAQAHANLCKFEHDRSGERAVENFAVGQNLLISRGTLVPNWDVSRSWYTTEVKHFRSEYINPFVYSNDYGHFSQVIWATTWKIGCGSTSYNDGRNSVLYTCNYGPAGNVHKGIAYIKGPPCSQCPKNTECSSEYASLCRSITPGGPQKERPSTEDFLLYCDFTEEDPEECQNVQISSTKELETRKIFTGVYKTVVLEPGDSVTLKLGSFQYNKGICPFVIGRLGPSKAGGKSGTVVNIKFSSPRVAFPRIRLTKTYSHWSTIGIQMNYNGKMDVSIVVEVSPESPPQYFDFKEFGVGAGKCR